MNSQEVIVETLFLRFVFGEMIVVLGKIGKAGDLQFFSFGVGFGMVFAVFVRFFVSGSFKSDILFRNGK